MKTSPRVDGPPGGLLHQVVVRLTRVKARNVTMAKIFTKEMLLVMVLMYVRFGMVAGTTGSINLSETSVDKINHRKHLGVHTMDISIHT